MAEGTIAGRGVRFALAKFRPPTLPSTLVTRPALMTDLVERWPARTVQLVLSSRSDPPLRQHRLRMSGDLCEIRDRDLYFSLAESRDLLAKLGAQLSDRDLAVLHERSEGWAAALQMAALSLRGTGDPAHVARALDVGNRPLAEYFVSEVLDQQPPEVVRFMLDVSVLGLLTADACAVVTGRQDAAAVLRGLDAAHLFLVALDDDRTSFRYHHLVRQVLRAELRARDPARERALQLLAAEWFESRGETRRAAHHCLTAQQADRALAVLQDGVVPDYLRQPVPSTPPDLSAIDPALLLEAPERLLALAAGWICLVIFLPLIGILAYEIVHGDHLFGRRDAYQAEYQADVPVQGRHRNAGSASDLAQLSDLHDRGVITDAEFQQGKEKILR